MRRARILVHGDPAAVLEETDARTEYRLSRRDLVSYYGSQRLGLNDAVIDEVLQGLEAALPAWDALIDASFLSDGAKDVYREIVAERRPRLFGS